MAAEVGIAGFSGVVSKVAELLFDPIKRDIFDPIKREVCYVFKYKSYVEKLRSQLGDLNNIKRELEQNVENAKRRGDKILDAVKECLNKTNDCITQAEKLVDEEKDKVKNMRCFKGLCLYLKSRRKLSKEAVNAGNDAKDLLEQCRIRLNAPVAGSPDPKRPETTNFTKGYQQFKSITKVFNNVMVALKDSNVNTVGVYGMGGVGKTTLATQVKKKVVEDKLFDDVVMAEVTQHPLLARIQDEIACDLGFTFSQKENEFARVGRLLERLKGKSVLVILDNIWGKLELEAIGIPFGNDEKEAKDVQSRCKVLLTSRSEHVLHNVMNSQKNFRIEVLSNEEAVILFWSTMNDLSAETSDFQRLADDIVRKCGGLPVAIKTIASALKSKPIEVWRDALNSLKNSDIRHIPGVESDVYSAIKLSYDFLENDEAKSLFRLCALQNDGSRILINDLMTYVMGSGWFKNVRRLKEVRDKVHALINNLKSSCLLLDGDNECVKMHDIIHAVGVSIAAEGRMINIQNVQDLKEELENVIPKDPVAISVTCGDIQKLPQRMECPELNLFLFFANYGSSLQIHSLFFEGMKKLRVLKLTRIVFSPSLFCLSNLRTLSLIDCHSVVDVALVGDLENLQILSFRGSDIEQLPLKIGQLTQLKKLDLTNCSRLKVIAPNVISKLSQLEELYMRNSFTRWEKGEGGSNASLVELNTLMQLNTLEINIPDVKIVPPDLVSQELERFKIYLGDRRPGDWDWYRYQSKTSRTLKIRGLVKSSYVGQGMKTLLKRAEELYLDELIGFHHFHEFDDGEGFLQLKYLFLKNTPRRLSGTSSASKEIVAENYSQDFITVLFNNKVTFPILEMLKLSSLDIRKIWPDQFSTCQNLTKLEVTNCRYLKFLFSYSMVCSLVLLQNLVIEDCQFMECVINTRIDEEQMIGVKIFSKLKSLILSGLPNFTRFVCMNSTVEQSLFNEKVTFPILETLKLSSLNIEKIWSDQFSTCQTLIELEVKNCSSLKFLFSYSMVPSLVRLQNLVIEGCESLECVINTSGLRIDEEQMIGVMIFSELKSLSLSHLSSLTRFVSMNSSDTQSFFNEKVTFPTLETLELNLSSLKIQKIWLDRFCPCQNLTTLKVQNCPHLKFLFSNSMVHSLEQLQNLVIEGCKSMEWVINTSELRRDEEQMIGVVVFPKLKSLELSNLPKLRRFVSMSSSEENGCEKVEILFGSSELSRRQTEGQQSMFLIDLDKVGLPSLEILTINRMSNLRKIWHHQLHLDSFSKLKQLEVRSCDKLMNIFSSNIILGRRFQRLEKVTVKHCELIKEIIEEETSSNRMVDEEFPIANTSIDTTSRFQVFPQLTCMELLYLPNLESFYQGGHMFEWPALKDLFVSNCEKVEILFGSSELLNQGADISQLIFLIDRDKVVFPKLNKLRVSWCNKLKNLMTILTVESLVELKRISISRCNMIEEIIPVGEVKVDHVVFSQLECLELNNLPRLKHFFGGNCTIEFPCLKQMIVSGCLNMEIFSQGVLQTPKLQKVQLTDNYCEEKEEWWEGSLNSTVQKMFEEMAGIYGLVHLILSQVPRVKEIWYDQTIPGNVFSNLWSLVLDDCKFMLSAIPVNPLRFLKNLNTLIVKNCDSVEEVVHIEELNTDEHSEQLFPKLWELSLINLPKLKRFCNFSGNIIELATLRILTIENCPNVETFISNSSRAQPLFNEKVIFPNLEKLTVCNCEGLRNLMTLSTVESLVKLKRIKIYSCVMIEEIVLLDGEVKVDPIFSQLESLELCDLPRLKHFFGGNCSLEFPYLKKVVVSGCLNMRIFSQGVLRTTKLRNVQLTNYNEENEGQENEERWEGSLNFTIQKMFEEMDGFYGLNSLILSQVPQVKEIWHGLTIHVGWFCNLSRLVLDDYELMSSAIPAKLLRFLKNLETLTVKNCDSVKEVFRLEELSADEHSVQLLPELLNLHLIDLRKLKRFVKGGIIALHYLQSLTIENCPNMETFIFNFTHAQPIVNEEVAFLNLTCLELSKLPKLLHLCKEFSSPIDVFQNLETLKILECCNLEQVVPSWVSFRNLVEMKISKCDGLKNLVALSAAESLVNLRKMKVTDCQMIEEIIDAKEEMKKASVVFGELKYLELSCLPSLISFCLGNYTLEFPSLEQVIVKECPKIEIFSRGVLCTPKLERLQLTEMEEEEIVKEDEWLWEGSLNSTIQKLFEEMNVQSFKDED